MTFLLLLFTGGCAFWDLKKRRIPNGMLLLGGLLFLLIRFGLGMKMGYTAGWSGRLPGYGAALMMGIGETCGYLIRVGSLLIVLFPLYLFRMIGAGDIKMAAVLFGAAGLRQGGRIFLCGLAAAGIWSLVLLIRRGIAKAAAYISCVLFVPVRAWGSVEPYYLEARDGKEASFCLAPCLFLGVIGAELIRYL
ncbi:MAG: prepilin peptidase [Clostridium fessum]